jgi:hypothetical protein
MKILPMSNTTNKRIKNIDSGFMNRSIGDPEPHNVKLKTPDSGLKT